MGNNMLKKVLFFACLFLAALQLSEAKQEKFDEIVSLGGRCQVSWQLEHHGLRRLAYPLDWLVTPFGSLIKFIEHEGQGLLDLDKIHIAGAYAGDLRSLEVIDTTYGIISYHDFYASPYMGNYAEIKDKYDRRVERLFKLLKSNKKVLFIRQGSSKGEIEYLHSFIYCRYPNLKYKILAVNGTEEYLENWNIPQVKNVYLNNDGFDWQGDFNAWKKILSNYKFRHLYTERPAGEVW